MPKLDHGQLDHGQLAEFAARGFLRLPHYLLGHNIGGNTSAKVRRAVYHRIKRLGHDDRWREFLQDP